MENSKNQNDFLALQEQVDNINCSIDLMRMEFDDSIASFLRSYSYNDDKNNNDNKRSSAKLQQPSTQEHIKMLHDGNRKLEEDLNELQVLQRSIETFIEEKQKQIDEEKRANEKRVKNESKTLKREICLEENPQSIVPSCELEKQYELILRESLPSSISSCSSSSSNSNSEDEEDIRVTVKRPVHGTGNDLDVCSRENQCSRVSTPIQNLSFNFNESIPLDEALNDQYVFQDDSTSHFYQKIGYIRTLLMMKKEISSRLVVDNCGCINIFEETSNTVEIQQEDKVHLDFSKM